jgi:hypothetical protein
MPEHLKISFNVEPLIKPSLVFETRTTIFCAQRVFFFFICSFLELYSNYAAGAAVLLLATPAYELEFLFAFKSMP